MTEISDRYRKVADALTERIEAVPPDAWDRPSPCEGWSARDVVGHLADSARRFLSRAEVDLPDGPSVAEDPVASWRATTAAVQAALEDPEVATTSFESGMGPMTLDEVIGRFGVGDVLVHTWDIARATGPKVDVPADADEQTQLIAFTGRRP